jgi:hypothetical protein
LIPRLSRRNWLSIPVTVVRQIGDHSQKEIAMKYILLIHHGDSPVPGTPDWDDLPEAEKAQIYKDYQALNETPGVTAGEGLDSPETATTVRVKDGETLITDGPFAETKEALNGFCTYEAEDLDAAIAIAAKIPAARLGGAIEVRPIKEW